MAAEKSLLTKIREKELEVSVRIDDVRTEGDRMIEQARKEAHSIINSSEAEGKRAADTFLERELKKIQKEAEQIRLEAKGQVESLRKKGENNIPNAVEKIIGLILSG